MRNLQARVLREEWEKREQMERLQLEQQELLELEKLKRMEFELKQENNERQLQGKIMLNYVFIILIVLMQNIYAYVFRSGTTSSSIRVRKTES